MGHLLGAHAIRAPEAPAAATYSGAQSVTVDTDDADVAITAAFGDTNRLDQKLELAFPSPTVTVADNGIHVTIQPHSPLALVRRT